MEETKQIKFKDLLKALKASMFSELFCRTKYKNYHIRGRSYRITYPFNPTLYNVNYDSLALFEFEIFVLVNNSHLRKAAKIKEISNFDLPGKRPIEFLKIWTSAFFQKSEPTIDLFVNKIQATIPEGEKLTNKQIFNLSKLGKKYLPSLYEYIINTVVDMFYIPIRDIEYSTTHYLSSSIKAKRPSIFFTINVYPTGTIDKSGKKSSKTVQFYEALACNLSEYARSHPGDRYDGALTYYNGLYDDLSGHFGPFPTTKEAFIKHLQDIATIGFEWIKSKQTSKKLLDLLNLEPITEKNSLDDPISYFCYSIIRELYYDITNSSNIRQCSYEHCNKFFTSEDEANDFFCSSRCKANSYSKEYYNKNRNRILPHARVRSKNNRDEAARERSQKLRRKELVRFSKSDLKHLTKN